MQMGLVPSSWRCSRHDTVVWASKSIQEKEGVTVGREKGNEQEDDQVSGDWSATDGRRSRHRHSGGLLIGWLRPRISWSVPSSSTMRTLQSK